MSFLCGRYSICSVREMASSPSRYASSTRTVGHTRPSEKTLCMWKSHFKVVYPFRLGTWISLRRCACALIKHIAASATPINNFHFFCFKLEIWFSFGMPLSGHWKMVLNIGPCVFWRKCICKKKTCNRRSKSLTGTSRKRNVIVNVCEKCNAFVKCECPCKRTWVVLSVWK